MRDLRFRIWKPEAKRMDSVYLEDYYGGAGLYDQKIGCNEANRVWLKYTGLKDRNGKEIYEGDIIEFDRGEWGGDDNIHVVSWDSQEGAWNWGGGSSSDFEFRTVIGNIYENANLLTTQN